MSGKHGLIKIICFVLAMFFIAASPVFGASGFPNFLQRAVNVFSGTGSPEMRSGLLTLSNTVENADGSALSEEQQQIEFEFTVTFSDGGDYTYRLLGTETDGAIDEVPTPDAPDGELHLVDGKLKLKHGQSAVFDDIPVGVVYTIIETPVPNYAISSENHTGTITEEGMHAVYKNIYRDDLPIDREVPPPVIITPEPKPDIDGKPEPDEGTSPQTNDDFDLYLRIALLALTGLIMLRLVIARTRMSGRRSR
jgi:hypothetical protein